MAENRMLICPICISEKWIMRYKIDRWDIEECAVCGFARIDPMPQRENRAEFYSQEKVDKRNVGNKSSSHRLSSKLKNIFGRIARRNKSGIFYKKLLNHLPRKARILDIGCGDGSFLKLAKNDFNCTGIEVSAYLADLAGKQGDLKIITGNFLTADFADNKYDGITLISLLEHLDDPAHAIERCFRLLNKGGALLLKTVNYGCLNRRIKKGDWTGFRPPDHVVYFNPRNLKLLLEKKGFKKIKIAAWPFNDNMYCYAWR